jgi:TetR/AcrR family transcriptional regulator, lmrAB and yxaGH operons repressor
MQSMTATEAGTRRNTRDRILDAAAILFRRHGYASTGIKAILNASDAPYGSLYHYFPGGKQEVGVEVIRSSGGGYRELVEAYFGGDGDLEQATAAFFEGAAAVVDESGYEDACPIATIALEVASKDDEMRRSAAEVFESWIAVVADRLVAEGVEPARARHVGIEFFCLIEGAFLLARTTRSVEALLAARDNAVALVQDALDAPSG